jgi:hypothetical protein
MDPGKVKAVLEWPTPTTVKDVQSFLGFANFYRRFIASFSVSAKPLTSLTKKDTIFNWSPECEAAFQDLKQWLVSTPVLAHYHADREMFVETDTSDYAAAAILSQINPSDNFLHPLAYFSRSMTPAELNYEIYDKELLAILACFREWRHYLEGIPHKIQVITDHRNLEYFSTTKLLTRCQARWSEFLQGFSYEVRY